MQNTVEQYTMIITTRYISQLKNYLDNTQSNIRSIISNS